MSARNVGSHFALTVVICLGVATLGLSSQLIPLSEFSAADLAVLPLSVKGLSSTTADDPVVSNGDPSANVAPKVAAAASWTNNTSSRLFEECGVANSNSLLSAASGGGSSRIAGGDLEKNDLNGVAKRIPMAMAMAMKAFFS